MAVSPVMVPSEADKERYKSFTTMIQRERELMDKKKEAGRWSEVAGADPLPVDFIT